MIKRNLRRPQFLIVDGAPGLEKALAAVWEGVPLQRCFVHKHKKLLAQAPERLHDEVTADYTDMIYAAAPKEIETRLPVASSALPLMLRAARSKKFPSIADSSRSSDERSGEIEVPLPTGTPRLLVLPNGDVLVAQQSAAYVTLLRDDGDWYGRRRGRPGQGPPAT